MAEINDLIKPIERLAKLYTINARLDLAEKITSILSGAAIALICIFLILLCMTFVSIGAVCWLKTVISPVAAYFIISGIYLAVIAILILFRRGIILNPIARFISKIILTKPIE